MLDSPRPAQFHSKKHDQGLLWQRELPVIDAASAAIFEPAAQIVVQCHVAPIEFYS